MKEHFKNLFVGFVILCLIVAALDLVIDNPYSQKLLGSYIGRIVARETNVRLTFESLNVNLIPIEANLFGVQVTPDSKAARVALAEATQVKIQISILSLFFGKPKISIFFVDNLNVHWPPPADFKAFLKEDLSDNADKTENPWLLQNLNLRNAQILVDLSQQKPDSRLHAGGIDVDINFKDMDVFSGKVSSQSIDFVYGAKKLIAGTRFSTNVSLNKEMFSVDGLKIKDQLFEVNTNLKGALVLQNQQSPHIRFNGKADSDVDLHLFDQLAELKNSHGHLKANAKFFVNLPFEKLENAAFYADGEAKAVDGYLDGNRIYDSQSHFFADNSGVKLKDAKVIVNQTQFAQLNGSILFNPNVDFSFSGTATGFPLSTIVSSFGPKFEEVDFESYSDNISFSGMGQPFKMNLTAQADLKDLRFPTLKLEHERFKQKPSCRANINLSIDPKRLSFNDSEALCFLSPSSYEPAPLKNKSLSAPANAQYASKVLIRNYIDFDDGVAMSIIAKGTSLALGRSFLQVNLDGLVDVETRIEEKNRDVIVTSQFTATNPSIEKVKFATAKGKLIVADQKLHWQKIHATNDKLTVVSENGNFAWEQDILNFDLHAENLPNGFVADAIGLFNDKELSKLSFAVKNLDGRFQIPINSLMQSRMKAQTSLSQVTYEGQEMATELSFNGEQDRNYFRFGSVKASIGSLPVSADLRFVKKNFDSLFTPNDEIDLSFTTLASDTGQNDFKALPFIKQYLEALNLTGLVQANGKITGKLQALNGFFDAKITNFTANKYPLYPLDLKGFVNKSKLQLFASQPGDNFLARLDFDFATRGIPFNWYFKLKQFDTKAFIMPPAHHDARNYSYLTAEWTWSGTLLNWWKSQGQLQLEDFSGAFFPPSEGGLSSAALFIKTEQAATVLMSPKAWTLKDGRSFKLLGNGIKLELGLKDSKPPERMGIEIKSSVDLSVLARLTPMIQSGTGTIAMKTNIDGSVDDLKLKSHIFSDSPGRNGSSGLTLLAPEISPPFQDINVDMTYENEQLLIQDLSARKGKGRLQINGLYDFSEKKSAAPSKIKASFDQISLDFAVPYLKSLHTILSGDLIISGNQQPYDVVGNVKIIRAGTDRFLDIETEAIKEYSARHIGPGFQDTGKPFFNFNVAIEASKSLAIQSKSLTLTMSSNLSLKGTNDKPLLSGTVLVDRGRFNYKRDFVISRGEMIFDNPLRNDPKIDITAAAQISSYTITIFISGNASKPLVDIVVDPPTKDDGSAISRLDAIVLLSTGRLPETEPGRAQDARNVVVTTGLNLYATQLPFDKFNELTGQKYISPYVNYTTDDQGNPVPQLNVPLHITDYIEAIIQQIPNRTSATIQVPLHDNISLSGSAYSTQRTTDNVAQPEDTQTQSVLDLRFVFPFN